MIFQFKFQIEWIETNTIIWKYKKFISIIQSSQFNTTSIISGETMRNSKKKYNYLIFYILKIRNLFYFYCKIAFTLDE